MYLILFIYLFIKKIQKYLQYFYYRLGSDYFDLALI